MSPRSKAQFEELREVARDKIMEATLFLIARDGYEETSITSIAQRAGVSKGLLYHYYENKESLLKELVDSMMTRQQKEMPDFNTDPPREALVNMIRFFFTHVREQYEWWRMIMKLTVRIEKFTFIQEMAKNKFN